MGRCTENGAEKGREPEREEEACETTLWKLRDELDELSRRAVRAITGYMEALRIRFSVVEAEVSRALKALDHIKDAIEALPSEGKLAKTLESAHEMAAGALNAAQLANDGINTLLAHIYQLSARVDDLAKKLERIEDTLNMIYGKVFAEPPPPEEWTQ